MKYILSPKDTSNKIILQNVDYFWQEGNTFCFRFKDGKIRNYPMIHIWYIEIIE